MDLINSLIDNYNLPILTAFLIGILTSISPCPLATNITAIAFISKDVRMPKHTILSGLFYTLGRGVSYTLLALLIYFGISSFVVVGIFQGWGDKVLGPILIIIGLVMFGVIRINLKGSNERMEKIKIWLADKGYLGSLTLGMLFAFAFCPYSGVLFFGILIPMTLKSVSGLLLPILFALGTGLPAIVFSFLIALSVKMVGKVFNVVSKIERYLRYCVAVIFIIVGIYYLKYLIDFLINI